MGAIRVDIQGSFKPNQTMTFSAETFGHTDAVAKTIEWLSSYILPLAIRQDHALQKEGFAPTEGFGDEKDKG